MTYSKNFGDLLERQRTLQLAGGFPTPSYATIRTAVIVELGELGQELKPAWAWWKKATDKADWNRERVIEEGADVLHFLLLLSLRMRLAYDELHIHSDIACFPYSDKEPAVYIAAIADALNAPYSAIGLLCAMLSHLGITVDEMVEAYWRKTEVNLQRWKEVPQPHEYKTGEVT